MITRTGTSVYCSLLEEVSSTSTIVKCIEDTAVEQGMITREQLKEKEEVNGQMKNKWKIQACS